MSLIIGTTVSPEGWASLHEVKPKKDKVLQRIAFDELLEVMQETNPQTSMFPALMEHVHKLYGPTFRARMKATIGGPRLRNSIAAMRL